jgi:LPS-assembly lipoprotein
MKKCVIILLVFVMYFLIPACGFHLRGSIGFQFTSLYIQTDSAKRIAQAVEQLLADEGKITLVKSAKESQIILHLEHEKFERRGQAISAVSGFLEEVELNLRVDMKVVKADGTIVQENQKLELIRTVSFDKEAILAKGIEEETIQEELLNDIVAQIVRRLRSVKMASHSK